MRIGGIQKQSLIDYPGNISSVIFTTGCNMRCKFCHNPELVLSNLHPEDIPEDKILSYLEENKNLLDAVVITGGEPTLHSDLSEFIRKVKALGLAVKLDTNGTNPKVLADVLPLVDYVAMDIKAPLDKDKYSELVGPTSEGDIARVKESVELIKKSGVKHEFRTTLIKDVHSEEDISSMAGVAGPNYVLQDFSPSKVLDSSYKLNAGFGKDDLTRISRDLNVRTR